MTELLARLRDQRFIRYLLASVGALAVDFGTFLALLSAGAGAVSASVAGYSLGIAAHWLLSSRKVFVGQIASAGAARHWQKIMFVLSALVGLAITTLVVSIGARLGFDPRLAKLGAVGASFIATWLLRSHIVFRPRLTA